jgi:RimJ/RimL family protein N-acetyltransferase
VTESPVEARAAVPAIPTVLRELRWSDFDALREAYYLLYEEREVHEELGITLFRTRPSYEDEVAWFAGYYRRAVSGALVAVVAERNGVLIGHCGVRRVGPSEDSEASHVGELGIMVRRDYRGTGVGRALLRAALRQCRGKFEVVRLSVFSVNTRARRLYEEFGFVYVGTIPRAIRRGKRYFDEDLMSLDLTPTGENR